jgi:hypothetical protein
LRLDGAYRLTAFGLNVECDWPLPGSALAPAQLARDLPSTVIRRLPADEIDLAWVQPGEPVLSPAPDAAEANYSAERTAQHYRFHIEGFGRYVVGIDGTSIACELAGAPRDQQERFVFAHALPLASVLQGYEVLHASSVSDGGGAVAFVGASGAGKTALASRLVIRGAEFVTDDVLALELRDGEVLAHPGAPFMAVRTEDRGVIAASGGVLGTVGTTDKVHVSPPKLSGTTRLSALYHLEAGPDRDASSDRGVAIAPLEGTDPRRLLAAAFVPYVMTPARLRLNLDIAQILGSRVAQFRLQTPRTGLTDAVLDALEAHMHELGVR